MTSKIVFRADFEGPMGPLNPGGIKLPGAVTLELWHSKVGPPAEWKVRRPFTRAEFKITPQTAFGTLANQIEGIYFRKQLTEWAAFDNSQVPPRSLEKGVDWSVDSQGKPFLTEVYREKLKAKKPAPAAAPESSNVIPITAGK